MPQSPPADASSCAYTRQVRPVEAADADVDDPRREQAAVVRGHRNPAQRDLGEVRLADG